jgi:NADPH:quinone reductase-like Zn-dependent oxidoreductase
MSWEIRRDWKNRWPDGTTGTQPWTEIEGNVPLGNEGKPNETPAHALWYVGPMQAELRAEPVAAAPDAVMVRTLWSGISRGTERLVASGRVPPQEHVRMRAPLQAGDFPFPVKYGYCAVGTVEHGPGPLAGRTVFVLHPHQDRFPAPSAMANVVPAGVPARRAILAANVETALNAVWDSGAGPGDRIVVVGAGVVGLLTGWICGRLPGAEVTMVDVAPARAATAGALGLGFAGPDAVPGDADIVFHTSASAAGLATAIDAAGFEATVVEMSWYGDGLTPAPLGGAFHSRRLRLLSSQVGHVAPSRRPRWSYARRMATAMAMLDDPRLDALITEDIGFSDLPAAIPRILAAQAPGLVTAVRYP